MLEARTVVFGRDPSCDEVLDAPSISWRHASITNGGGLPLLKDLGSTNGTFLNGRRVIAPVPVKPGDVIHLGTYALRLGGNGKLEKRDDHGNVTIEAQPRRGGSRPASVGQRFADGLSHRICGTDGAQRRRQDHAHERAQRLHPSDGGPGAAQRKRPLCVLCPVCHLPGLCAAGRHPPSRADGRRGALFYGPAAAATRLPGIRNPEPRARGAEATRSRGDRKRAHRIGREEGNQRRPAEAREPGDGAAHRSLGAVSRRADLGPLFRRLRSS